MEYRLLGGSGLKVPVLSLGAATFGGGTEFFRHWGSTQVQEATRLLDICLEAGLNLFDSADTYSAGLSEEILGQAIGSRRDQVLIATKATGRNEPGPNGLGTSRFHLIRSIEASLRRLRTDYIDIYQMHGFDALTPVEETLRTLDDLVRSGKVRYIGCSNYSGWHLMKSLAVSGEIWARALCRAPGILFAGGPRVRVGADAAGDRPARRHAGLEPAGGRAPDRQGAARPAAAPGQPPGHQGRRGAPDAPEYLYGVVDVLDEVAQETGKTIAQVALNWLLQRPTVSSIIIGARNEEQLRQNLGAVGWNLTAEQVARLDKASALRPIYPYWHQLGSKERNPFPTI